MRKLVTFGVSGEDSEHKLAKKQNSKKIQINLIKKGRQRKS